MRSSCSLLVTFCFLVSALLGKAVTAAIATLARPHRPLFPYKQGSCGTDFASSDEAAVIPNPYLSWAYYHYFDCTSRAVWARLNTPAYGPGVVTSLTAMVPTRFNVTLSAVIVGPGLPPLPDHVFQALPAAVRDDPIWNSNSNTTTTTDRMMMGAVYIEHDYSACRYFGPHYSSHYNGTHCVVTHHHTGSQMVLTAHLPHLRLPLASASYYLAVFANDDVSTKAFISLGTQAADFVTPYNLPQPTCERNVQQDFYERLHPATTAACFPQVSCPALRDDNQTIAVCAADDDECVVHHGNHTTANDLAAVHNDLGSCGGDACPAAIDKWYSNALHPLLQQLTNLEYSGNVAVDLVRGLISLETAAVELCRTLLQDLECVNEDDDDDDDEDHVDGLADYCQHVTATVTDQVEQMVAWLENQGLNATALCSDDNDRRNLRAIVPYSHTENEACGETDTAASQALMHSNKRLDAHLAIRFSCQPTADFVRLAMPRHAAAFDRCTTAMRYYHPQQHDEDDDDNNDDSSWFIPTLCANVTQAAAREIAWLYAWLQHRHLSVTAYCPDCDDNSSNSDDEDESSFVAPCEDLLPLTAFCRDINLGLCHCSALPCHAPPAVFSHYGVFDPRVLCPRTCGHCPSSQASSSSSSTVWMNTCPAASNNGSTATTSSSSGGAAAATADTSGNDQDGRTANIAAIVNEEPRSAAAASGGGSFLLVVVVLFLAALLLLLA